MWRGPSREYYYPFLYLHPNPTPHPWTPIILDWNAALASTRVVATSRKESHQRESQGDHQQQGMFHPPPLLTGVNRSQGNLLGGGFCALVFFAAQFFPKMAGVRLSSFYGLCDDYTRPISGAQATKFRSKIACMSVNSKFVSECSWCFRKCEFYKILFRNFRDFRAVRTLFGRCARCCPALLRSTLCGKMIGKWEGGA